LTSYSDGKHASLLTDSIHSLWEKWSSTNGAFRGERPDMQNAFVNDLQTRLPDGWQARREARISAPHGFSAWRMYDIGIFRDEQLVGLLELSYDDTNVPHALHNGELKLLGACGAVRVPSGREYHVERHLDEASISSLCNTLAQLAVRGLFFVNPGPRATLDRPDRAIWWETKATGFSGETRFWSQLLAPGREATLRQAFSRLAGAGLHCWFYSLCGEGRLEILPTNFSRN